MTVRPQTEPAENKPGAAARLPAEPPRVDRLIRAHAIHSMTGETYRSVGLRGAEIAAVSEDPDGLDALAGQATVVVEADDLTMLPAFADSHEHLIEASRNTLLVPVDKARSVAEFTGMLAEAAKAARPGAWIVTSIGWHESNLAEDRVPTLAELDAAVPDHPVLARRGGHFAVVKLGRAAGGGRRPRNAPIRRAARSEGWPTAAETVRWKAARCIRSPLSRPDQAEPSWPPLWARARPRTPLWGRAPSGRR